MTKNQFILMFGTSVFLFVAGLHLMLDAIKPLKVHAQPDPLMLQEACITGYVGILKPITIDLVVDANVYCSEKYPK